MPVNSALFNFTVKSNAFTLFILNLHSKIYLGKLFAHKYLFYHIFPSFVNPEIIKFIENQFTKINLWSILRRQVTQGRTLPKTAEFDLPVPILRRACAPNSAQSLRSQFAACSTHTIVNAATESKSASVKESSSKDRSCTCFYGRQAACSTHTVVNTATESKSASVKECSSKDHECTCFYGRQAAGAEPAHPIRCLSCSYLS